MAQERLCGLHRNQDSEVILVTPHFAFKENAKKRTAPFKMTSKSELDFNKLPFEPCIVHFGAAVWEI